jgi:hypothetical protein
MKAKRVFPPAGVLLALALALIPVWLAGCGTTGGANVSTDGTSVGGEVGWNVSSNAAVNVSGHYNTATGQWMVAVGVTFRETPPPDVIAALEAAGAVPGKTGRTWIFPAGMKPTDNQVIKALTACATAPGGYVLMPVQ